MNKYKKGFTPEEAALIAVGLSQHQEIPHTRQQLYPQGFHSAETKDSQDTIKEDNEKIAQAHEIMEALIDETYLSYKFEGNESGKKSVLVIYKHAFYNQDEDYLYSEKTQLTKASLSKWFQEADERNISNLFKEPEIVAPINYLKQAYTAEHAALIAVGLQSYNSIDTAIVGFHFQENKILEEKYASENGAGYPDFEIDKKLFGDSIPNATNLKEALIDEIKLAYKWEEFHSTAQDYASIGIDPNSMTPNSHTDIVIHQEVINEDKKINYNSTLVTKKSVATWLWHNGQTNYATNILPNIENILKEEELIKAKNQKQWATYVENTKDKASKNSRTPDSSLVDSLGIMAWLLSTKATKLKRSDKPNASQIRDVVETVINDLGLNENTDNKIMLSNLNKDISTALKQLEGRFKL